MKSYVISSKSPFFCGTGFFYERDFVHVESLGVPENEFEVRKVFLPGFHAVLYEGGEGVFAEPAVMEPFWDHCPSLAVSDCYLESNQNGWFPLVAQALHLVKAGTH